MKNTTIRQGDKSASCRLQNKQKGSQNSAQGLLQEQAKNNGQELALNEGKITRGYKLNEPCSDISISSQVLEDSALQPNNSEGYEQLSLLKLTPMHKQSCDRTSQEYQFTLISETISLIVESLTLLPADSPVLAQVTRELEQVLSIPRQPCGKKVYELSRRRNPNSWWLNNQQEFRDEDYELFLEDSEWQDIEAKLKLSQRADSEQVTEENGCLLFPTLTSGQTSTKMRPAGQTKCERWWKNKGLIPNGSQLGTSAIALIMGFPSDWLMVLQKESLKNPTIQNLTEPQVESEADTSQGEPLRQDKQQSPFAESSISIPCLIRQPHKKPFEGLIVGDRGSKFDVRVGDRVIQLPKLYVFPNLKEKKKPQAKDDISPSKNSRRKKGTGSGYINWRDIRKNGKDYKQTWFHYELWDKGRQVKSCAYIPKGKRSQIEKLNAEKVPVEEILKVLRNKERGK